MSEENVFTEINRAYYPLIARICAISVGLDILYFVLFILTQSLIAFWFLVVVYILKLIVFIALAIAGAYKWTEIYYYIDSEQDVLIKNVGLHFPKTTTYSLKNLHSVYSFQNPFSKVLKYGDIILTFTNREGNKEEIIINEIVEPQKYKEIFDKYLRVSG